MVEMRASLAPKVVGWPAVKKAPTVPRFAPPFGARLGLGTPFHDLRFRPVRAVVFLRKTVFSH